MSFPPKPNLAPDLGNNHFGA